MAIDGGSKHYKSGAVEPLELTEAQDLSFHMGNVVKYAVRADYYRKQNEWSKIAEQLDKAIWYCLRYKELYGTKRA